MFGSEEIEHLRKIYNAEHPLEQPIETGSTDEVWNSLRQRFHKKCQTGRSECIIAHMINRPKAPDSWITKPTDWLSSLDIERVEKEYTRLFPSYAFLGCIPIDFDLKSETGKCLVDALCSIDIRSLYKKGKTRIGIVFNTDVHTGPGQHWIALFCDIRPELQHGRITYFDSYSHKPEREIQTLMKRWKEQWDQTGVHDDEMIASYNSTKHQFKDTECGMYCLYFHYACLTEVSMEDRIPDDVINTFRRLLFKRN